MSAEANPGSPGKKSMASALLLSFLVSDADTLAMAKFDRLLSEAGSLDALDPSLFTPDEMARLSRLNDLGIMDG